MVRFLLAASSPFQMKNYSPSTDIREEGQDMWPVEEGHLVSVAELLKTPVQACHLPAESAG